MKNPVKMTIGVSVEGTATVIRVHFFESWADQDSLRGKTVFVPLSISFDSIFDRSFDFTTRHLECQRPENLLKHSSAHKGENKHKSVLSSHSDSQDRTNWQRNDPKTC
ncbi:hypothetical protein BLNAU_21660 [Blattamonas nauphoetae]|uniref:Uncharacterized protein n=1 Tax=Blattamonas nauphoetae TaxID=2049346 RepID=A0ABQ9WVA8_9EUKA|nr:hypothetical protein BLNAU_21660 [Blattamonas nauphoetae]